MEQPPFKAIWATMPWSVLACDQANGIQLWTGNAWLRHRGGLRAHYGDLQTGRTIMVDHFEFRPDSGPGRDHDDLNRTFYRVSLAMVFGIAISRDQAVDEAYFRRCFERDDAERIMDAIGALVHVIKNEPQPTSDATRDIDSGIVSRNRDIVMLR